MPTDLPVTYAIVTVDLYARGGSNLTEPCKHSTLSAAHVGEGGEPLRLLVTTRSANTAR